MPVFENKTSQIFVVGVGWRVLVGWYKANFVFGPYQLRPRVGLWLGCWARNGQGRAELAGASLQ